ncbi:MAG: choice-of-anchor Q domain-containing protein [Anaerolineae bacterium]
MVTLKGFHGVRWSLALIIALGMGLLLHPLTVWAGTITVTSTLDSGPGTLRQAIIDGTPGDWITFAPALDGQTITLASPLVISAALTIDGSSLGTPVTVSGNDAVRVFHIYTDTHVTLDSLTIAHGRVTTGDTFSSSPRAGGILIEPGAVVTLTRSAVVSNTATYYDPDWEEYTGNGGGIYNLGTLTVIDTTFTDNVAASRTGYVTGSGGAIYNRGTLTVTGSTLTGNAAESGGAIYSRSGTRLAVESSTISNNTAPCGGSGISNRGTATVSNSTISDNVVVGDWCEAGAAGISNDYGAMTVKRSTISGNINGSSSGGGLSNYGSNPDQGRLTVIDSAIYSNTVHGDGGGIWNWWDSVLTVTNSSIYSNTAGWYGGGIFSGGNVNTKLTLINSTFSHNMAQNGGGLCNGSPGYSAAVLSMTNSTVVSNTATGSGGGFYNQDSINVTLDNNILWGNTASTDPQIYNSSTNRPTIRYSDIQGSGGSGAGWNASLGSDGGGNIDADPQLGPLGDYGGATHTIPLLFNSPAIDAGDDAVCPATDQRGEARDDWACDIGAFEARLSDTTLVSKSVSGGGTYTFGPTLARIVVTDTGGCLTGLQVEQVADNHPNATTPLQTGAYWVITPTGCTSGFTTTLTLPFAAANASSRLCRWLEGTGPGAGWDCDDETASHTTFVANTWVIRSHVAGFSDWAVGNDVTPTAVRLRAFAARGGLLWGVGLLLVFGTGVVVLRRRK